MNLQTFPRNSRAELLRTASVLLLVTAALYGHTLHVPFYLDDNAVFNGTYLLRDLPAAARNLFSQRGLTNLSFAVNFRVANWSLAALHLINIALHAGCGILVWLLLRQFSTRWLSLAGALLFIAHPLQTQGVTYLSQRATVLAAFFFLLAFLAHLRAQAAVSAVHGRRTAAYLIPYLGAITAGSCAVLSKENTAVLPLMLMVYDRLFPLPVKQSWRKTAAAYLPFFVMPLLLGINSVAAQLAAKAVGYSPYPLESLQHNSPLHYMVTQFSVMWVYLRLLILPYGQALEHDYPVTAELLTVPNGVALAGLLAVTWLVWRVRRRRPLLAFGVTWFFLALAVESSIIPLDPLFEHRLYLPMFGFVLVLLDGVPVLMGERRTVLALSMALLVCMPLTWRRNALWNDPVAFYEDNLRVVPNSERAMIDLASRYEEDGQYQKMRQLLERAVQLRPQNHDFYTALAEIHAGEGRFEQAIALLERGLVRMPGSLELYERAALVAEQFGRRDLIFTYLQRGMTEVTTSRWRLLNDLGIYYTQQGDLRQAEEVYRKSLDEFADNPVAWQYLGALYFTEQRWHEAMQALQSANRLEPGNPDTLRGIGRTALVLGDLETARWAADKLRFSDPALWGELQTAISRESGSRR